MARLCHVEGEERHDATDTLSVSQYVSQSLNLSAK